MTVEIFNRGTKELHVSSITFDGPNASDFTVTTGTAPGACSSLTPTLAVGTSCTATLAVKRPTADWGYLDAYLKIASDDPTRPVESIFVQGYEYPPPAGVVSGRMKDAQTQQGVSGVVQFIEAREDYEWVVREQWTDQSGAFSVTGLSSGNYKIKYLPNDGYYIEQWHQGKQSQESATIVKITPADFTLPDAALVRGAGMIQGVVKDGSNNSVMQYVSLAVYDPQTKKPVAFGYTGATGDFHISRIPAGRYVLKVGNAGGYWAPRWEDVTVSAGSTTSLGNIPLYEGGQISGTIRDAGSQAGVDNVHVIFYDGQSGDYAGETYSNGGGSYTMTGLPTGSYKILFSGEAMGYQKLWYGNAQSMALATATAVTAPNSVAGINGTLARVVSTRTTLSAQSGAGQVTLTATVSSGSGVPGGVVLFKEGDAVLGTAQLNLSGQATVTIPLSVGTHYIYAYYNGNSSYNTSYSDHVSVVIAPQTFNLSVVIAGNGSVNSSPSGIACTTGSSANCSKNFPAGNVTLMQTAFTGSVFSGWSGACSGTGNCLVTVDSAKTVTATFTAQPGTVYLEGAIIPYYSLRDGVAAVKANGKELRAKAQSFTEHLILSDPYVLKLSGGFTDGLFSTRSDTSFTILSGSLRIRQGTLRVERFKIR